ncbi:hypothetical protein ABXN37_11885 [Piscinibacter sakaiensis]|uniref:hypothetical protein n=1 Tax=Piscinibacter sakaiensis TaxID=1547922 RepID=UPI0037277A27
MPPVPPAGDARAVLVMLHGLGMDPAVLRPFVASLALPAWTLLPTSARCRWCWPASRRGRCWPSTTRCWPIRRRRGLGEMQLLSGSCIAVDEWRPALGRLRGLPALVAHGRDDPDLGVFAGERLRDLRRALCAAPVHRRRARRGRARALGARRAPGRALSHDGAQACAMLVALCDPVARAGEAAAPDARPLFHFHPAP